MDSFPAYTKTGEKVSSYDSQGRALDVGGRPITSKTYTVTDIATGKTRGTYSVGTSASSRQKADTTSRLLEKAKYINLAKPETKSIIEEYQNRAIAERRELLPSEYEAIRQRTGIPYDKNEINQIMLDIKGGKLESTRAQREAQYLEGTYKEYQKNPSYFDKYLNKLDQKNIISDSQTQQQVYRVQVQDFLDRNLVNNKFNALRSPIEDVQKRFIEVQKQRQDILGKIQDSFTKSIQKNNFEYLNSVVEKARRKQTLTPQEIKQLSNIANLNNKELQKKQLNTFIAGSKYLAKNLNPIKFSKDFLSAGKRAIIGSYEFGKDISRFSTFIGQQTRKALENVKNYKRELNERKKSGEKNPLENDIKLVYSNIKKVGYKNSQKAILGLAVAGGVVSYKFAKNTLKNIGKRAYSGDIGGLTFDALTLMSAKAPKNIKLSSSIPTLYTKNNFRIKTIQEPRGIIMGGKKPYPKTNVEGNLEFRTLLGKKYKAQYTIRTEEKTGLLKININYFDSKGNKLKSKTSERYILEDKGEYYLRKDTGEKIKKQLVALKDQRYTEKTQRISKTGDVNLYFNSDLTGSRVPTSIQTEVLKVYNGVKKIVKRGSLGELAFLTPKGKYKGQEQKLGKFQQLFKEITKSRTSKQIKLTQNQINKIEDFLKFIKYDKEILSGLDRRNKLAKVLGITKNDKRLKVFETIIKENRPTLIYKSSKFTATGEKIKDNLVFFKKLILKDFLPQFRFLNKNSGKKGQFNISFDIITPNKNLMKTQRLSKGEIQKTFLIPNFKLNTKFEIELVKLGLLKRASKLSRLLQTLKNNNKQIQNIKNIKTISQIKPLLKTRYNTIDSVIKLINNLKTTKKVQTTKMQNLTKLTNKNIFGKRINRINMPIIELIPKKVLRLSLDDGTKDKITSIKRANGLILYFDGKSKKPIRTEITKQPYFKSYLYAQKKLLTNSKLKLATILPYGKTSKQDIKKVLLKGIKTLSIYTIIKK